MNVLGIQLDTSGSENIQIGAPKSTGLFGGMTGRSQFLTCLSRPPGWLGRRQVPFIWQAPPIDAAPLTLILQNQVAPDVRCIQ